MQRNFALHAPPNMQQKHPVLSEKAVEILDLSKSQKYYSMQTYYILYAKGFDGAKKHLQRFLAEKIDRAVLIFLQLKGKVSFTTEWEITANTYFGHQLIDMPEELQKYWQNLFLRGICIDIPDLRIDSPTNPLYYNISIAHLLYEFLAFSEDNMFEDCTLF